MNARTLPRHRLPACAGALAICGLIATAAWHAHEAPGPIAVAAHLPHSAAAVATAPRALPVQFTPNRGQADAAVRYVARGQHLDAQVYDDGIAVAGAAGASPVRLHFVGTRAQAPLLPREAGAARTHYLQGGDATRWVRDVPAYRQLRQPSVYPGIDLVYYGREGELEYDLVVQPGADPSAIRMRIEADQRPLLDASGDLLLDGREGSLRLHRPVLYQHIAGERRQLDGRYVMLAANEVGFELPAYDHSHPLVIDPTFKLLYSSYVTGFHDDAVNAMVLDAQGNAYVLGRTNSDDFAVSANAVQTAKSTTGLQYNLVVTKFDAAGTLLYATYLGGSAVDSGGAIAVDAAGNAYVTGNTTSHDFPVTPGAQQTVFKGTQSAFLSVLSPDGSALAYSTFYGSNTTADATGVLLDASGAAVIAGTAGPGLATTAGAYKPTLATGAAAFVARFSPLATGMPHLLAASYYGVDNPQANSVAQGVGVLGLALDASGAPWITGQAFTTNLPITSNALQTAPAAMSATCAAGPGPLNGFAYVAKLSANLDALAYASYLSGKTEPVGGTSCSEFGRALALDAAGNVYVTGGTGSAAFPTTTGALQPSSPVGSGFASYTSFVTKLKPDGSGILWSTYLGGSTGNTFTTSIAMDPANGALWTNSVTGGGSNYPVSTDALQKLHGGGGADAGVVQLDATTGALKYASYLGGSGADVGAAIGIDPSGNVLLAGNTLSANFPVSATASDKTFRPDAFGGGDWFFSVLGSGAIARVTPSTLGTGADGTLTITGAGFASDASCSLSGGGSQLASQLSGTDTTGTSLSCSFNLAALPAGSYDLTVTNGDGTHFTRSKAVTVATGSGSDISVNVIGRATLRAGVASTFSVSVSNSGNADAYNVMLFVHYSAGMGPVDANAANPFGLSLIDPALIAFGDGNAQDYTKLPIVRPAAEGDGSSIVQLIVPFIGAGQTVSLPFPLVAKTDSVESGEYVEAWAWASMGDSLADFQGPVSFASSAREQAASARARPLGSSSSNDCQKAIQDYAFQKALDKLKDKILDKNVWAKAEAKLIELMNQAAITGHAWGHNPSVQTGFGAAVAAEQMFPKFVDAYGATAAALGIRPALLAEFLKDLADAMQKADEIADLSDKCKDKTKPKPSPKGSKTKPKVGGARDPNDIAGPAGDGSAAHYLDGTGTFSYEVEFENVATATLPAAEVVVTLPLDAAKFDLSTLTLGHVFIGNRLIAVPAGVSSHAATVALGGGLSVRVQGSLNPSTGVLKWTFTTLDAATGLPPSDPTLGFLPPDTDGVSGQGRVLFNLKPKAGLAQGSTWTAKASIVFDANAPIATPAWVNTLDTIAPVSHVLAASAPVTTSSFDVAWSGTDTGAGAQRYSVYVSDNGAPFAAWQGGTAATHATYAGTAGHVYGFYAIATDGAGNTEAAKSTAEASITAGDTAPPTTVGVDGGGGGCTLGTPGQRDASLPLWLLLAAGVLWLRRVRSLSATVKE